MSIESSYGIPPMTVRFQHASYCKTLSWIETKEFVEDVLASGEKSPFSHVSAIRTTLTNVSRWKGRGPFTPLDFRAMMSFHPEISNEAWLKHLAKNSGVVAQEASCCSIL